MNGHTDGGLIFYKVNSDCFFHSSPEVTHILVSPAPWTSQHLLQGMGRLYQQEGINQPQCQMHQASLDASCQQCRFSTVSPDLVTSGPLQCHFSPASPCSYRWCRCGLMAAAENAYRSLSCSVSPAVSIQWQTRPPSSGHTCYIYSNASSWPTDAFRILQMTCWRWCWLSWRAQKLKARMSRRCRRIECPGWWNVIKYPHSTNRQ